MTSLVLVHCSSGLSNRIKGLISGQQAAAELGVPMRVYWELNSAVRTPLDKLFVHNWEYVDASEIEGLVNDPKVVVVRTWRLWPPENIAFPPDYRPPYPSPHRYGIDFAYHAIPDTILNVLRIWFAKLEPVTAIQSALDEIFAGETRAFTGMAVRTWVDAPERQKLFDAVAVASLIESETSRFYVTSDSRQYVQILAQQYPQKVLHSLGHTSGLTSDQAALCDLLAVAHCPFMYVSLGSTFSEVAWWLGGATAKVEIIPARGYWFNIVDLGEVAGYALANRWFFRYKRSVDGALSTVWRKLFGLGC